MLTAHSQTFTPHEALPSSLKAQDRTFETLLNTSGKHKTVTISPNTALIVAAAIIRTCDKGPAKVLAAQRSYPPLLAGQWEFPGGKVEIGEHPEDALIREIREELSVDITLGPAILGPHAGDWPLPNGKLMRLWTAHTNQTPVLGSSHSALRWICADDVENLPWLPGDLQILPSIRSFLESHSPTPTP